MLTIYDWVYGVASITAVLLSIIAGVMALTMFEQAKQRKHLAAWNPLLVSLILFAVEEVLSVLNIFGIWSTTWLTHVVPSFIMLFLISAIIKQIQIVEGGGR